MLSERTSSALSGIAKATCKEGVRVKHLFRIMTHCEDLWLAAYAKVYSNKGAMTEGVDGTTMDGMCLDRIRNLISLLKDGRYHPKPARRVYIPKSNGKKRPLGIPCSEDKLVQEVMRMLLEQVYEPVFSNHSHGFRPNRSCHTALQEVKATWRSTKWVIDMDISSFYDSIDHEKLVDCLEQKIDDRKFITVVKKMLRAGYLENWKFHGTYSGTPQGGICSPILANVFLHELDKFLEKRCEDFNRGIKRRMYEPFSKLNGLVSYRRKILDKMLSENAFDFAVEDMQNEIKRLHQKRLKMPAADPMDPGYRRMRFVRYADDFVVGVIGNKEDAEKIKGEIEDFVRTGLNLSISKEKSGIHHMAKGFDFLGYYVRTNSTKSQKVKRLRRMATKDGRAVYQTSRSCTGHVHLSLPKQKVWAFCNAKGYLRNNKPIHRNKCLHLSDFEIVSRYNSEMRGFANYYALADKTNLYILEWAGVQSMFKTLAGKHKTKTAKIRPRMKKGDDHVLRYQRNGKNRELKVFKMKYRAEPKLVRPENVDREPIDFRFAHKSELLARLAASECEYCGKTKGYFEVHHIRKMKDVLQKPNKKPWEILMAGRNRKTLILCQECHDELHAGRLSSWKRNVYTKTESAVQ